MEEPNAKNKPLEDFMGHPVKSLLWHVSILQNLFGKPRAQGGKPNPGVFQMVCHHLKEKSETSQFNKGPKQQW